MYWSRFWPAPGFLLLFLNRLAVLVEQLARAAITAQTNSSISLLSGIRSLKKREGQSEIEELYRTYWRCMIGKDIAGMERLMADDYEF